MSPKKVNVHIQRNTDTEGGFGLFVFKQDEKGKGLPVVAGKSLEFEKKEMAAGGEVLPVVVVSDEAAQELFDDLWNAGLRPRGDAVNFVPQPLLEAKEAHIDQLFTLFKLCLERSRMSN